jgi:hypothetical protein
MKQNYLKLAVVASMVILAGVLATSCGSSKKVAKTPEQKAAVKIGVKVEREECEELAIKESKNWRAFGIGTSLKKPFAYDLAEVNAKARLARQLEEQINTLITSFNQQYPSGNAQDLVGKDSGIVQGYADQLLRGVKVILSNTYVKEDGSYEVYVCVEMDEENLSRIHKKLSDDKKISIDFAEHQFKQEMEKAKEEYRNRQ